MNSDVATLPFLLEPLTSSSPSRIFGRAFVAVGLQMTYGLISKRLWLWRTDNILHLSKTSGQASRCTPVFDSSAVS